MRCVLLVRVVFFILLPCYFSLSSFALEPYRIFVDKVFSRNPTSQISDEDYAFLASLDFNVICPRWSNFANGFIPRDLELCGRHNLRFLPWMRGTFANNDEATQDKRLTTVGGISAPLFSPCSDEFWQILEERFLRSAEIPAPNLGIFLDFEHYAKPKIMEPYSISYDQDAMRQFAAATGKKALEDKEAFREWTLALWRQRSKALAEKVKAKAPEFKAFIYPVVSTPFLSELSRALLAAGIPVYSAEASTYNRPTFLSLDGAAEHVSNIVKNGNASVEEAAPGAKYLAGLDPLVKGSTPSLYDVTLRKAAEHGAGYWIFFEGVHKNIPLRDEYCAAFKRANTAILNENFSLTDVPPEKELPPPPTFERPGTKKVFVSGQRRRSISRFLNDNLPSQYEAFHMNGAVLAEIDHFDILVIQNLRLTAADHAKTISALRSFVNRGGSILFSYGSVLEPVQFFPEFAIPPAEHAVHSTVRRIDRTRLTSPALPDVDRQLEVFYLYHLPLTPGSAGQILATDQNQNCLAVGGILGKGRVIFSGDFFGRQDGFDLKSEQQYFLSLLKWLQSGDSIQGANQ